MHTAVSWSISSTVCHHAVPEGLGDMQSFSAGASDRQSSCHLPAGVPATVSHCGLVRDNRGVTWGGPSPS